MPVPLIAVRTVILVRHAEVNNGINPALSQLGQQRAILLARMLRDINLKAMAPGQFDRMFLIIRSLGTALTRLRYGASTP